MDSPDPQTLILPGPRWAADEVKISAKDQNTTKDDADAGGWGGDFFILRVRSAGSARPAVLKWTLG